MYGQEGGVRDGRLVAYREADQISKHIKNIGNQVSCCQRTEVETWTGKMNPVLLDWNWRYGCANTFFNVIDNVESTDVNAPVHTCTPPTHTLPNPVH